MPGKFGKSAEKQLCFGFGSESTTAFLKGELKSRLMCSSRENRALLFSAKRCLSGLSELQTGNVITVAFSPTSVFHILFFFFSFFTMTPLSVQRILIVEQIKYIALKMCL